MRHKLIPTQGTKVVGRWVYGRERAEAAAAEWFEETGVPVLVVEAPEGGLLREVATVPPVGRGKR